jgi:2-dehydropantoate 2-reductase
MRIGIFGAGAIGCYLGARLANAGSDLVLVGRKRLLDAVARDGLHFEGLKQSRQRVDDARLSLSEDARALKDCDYIFVTVKSGQTREAGEVLSASIGKSSLVVSFQNGIRNTSILQEELPENPILAGIVPFNVVWNEPAVFKQGTSGPLVIEDAHDRVSDIAKSFAAAGLPIELVADMLPLQWGKLLMNLNNAINALSGLPLQQELADRDYRVCLAASQAEALHVLKKSGTKIASPLKAPLSWVPFVLRSPTPVFSRVARAMLQVGPEARSSMSDDLRRGRKTEIDFLNGEIVALALTLSTAAPVNAAIVDLIRSAEEAGAGSPGISGQDLRMALSL